MSQSALVRRALVAAFATLSLASPLPAQDAAVAREIIKLEDQWGAASIKRDGATVGKMLSDDLLGVTAKGAHNSKANIIKEISGDTTHYVSGANSDYKAHVFGNTVVIVGVWKVTKKGVKANVTERYAWTDTWMKQADGRWLCVSTQSTQVK